MLKHNAEIKSQYPLR